MVLDAEEHRMKLAMKAAKREPIYTSRHYEPMWFHIDELFIEHLRSRFYLFTIPMVQALVRHEAILLECEFHRTDRDNKFKQDAYDAAEASLRKLQNEDPDPYVRRGLSLEQRLACIQEGLDELTNQLNYEPD